MGCLCIRKARVVDANEDDEPPPPTLANEQKKQSASADFKENKKSPEIKPQVETKPPVQPRQQVEVKQQPEVKQHAEVKQQAEAKPSAEPSGRAADVRVNGASSDASSPPPHSIKRSMSKPREERGGDVDLTPAASPLPPVVAHAPRPFKPTFSLKNPDNAPPSGPFHSLDEITLGLSHDFLLHYRPLGKSLGKGSYAQVFLYESIATGEKVAVKKILKEKVLDDPRILHDLHEEIKIMQRMIKCLNAASFIDAFEDESMVMIVMEYCEGGELYQRIKKRVQLFSETDAARIVSSILRMVAACHANNVFHRDIKPENLLYLTPAEESPLKVIDFGLATIVKPGERVKEIAGTPHYMAPEVLKRQGCMASDVWTTGVIMYFLLSGRRPFGAGHLREIVKKIIAGKYNLTEGPWATVSPSAKDLVKRLMTYEVEQRISALEALHHPWIVDETGRSRAPLEGNVVQRLQQFANMSTSKRSALQLFAHKLDVVKESNIQELNHMFEEWDTSKDGILSIKELSEGFKRAGFQLSDAELSFLQSEMDLDSDGVLNVSEFLTALCPWKKLAKGGFWDTFVVTTFAELDLNSNGMVEKTELASFIAGNPVLFKTASEGRAADDYAASIIDLCDKDRDGRISLKELQDHLAGSSGKELPAWAYDSRGGNVYQALVAVSNRKMSVTPTP
eukprot:jgi/Mesvir1/27319/Mv07140-RA.1